MMPKRSGSANFYYDIERYIDRITGDIYREEGVVGIESDYDYKSISLYISGYSYYTPARTNCLPEDSYPEEGETEILSATDCKGKDWRAELSDSEVDSILELIIEKSSNVDDVYNEDYDDTGDYRDNCIR
jgi:hypothetical protein